MASNRKNIKVKKGENVWSSLRKKALESSQPISNERTKREMEDFNICHHCKNFFTSNNLVKCNYRSSTMGLPVMNSIYTDPILLGNFKISSNNLSIYNKKNAKQKIRILLEGGD
jgi:hypothetical protein